MKVKDVFFSKTNNTWIQLFRSLFVGGIATVVDFGVTAIVRELFFGGSDNWKLRILYVLCGFIAGLIANYVLSRFFVFGKSTLSQKKEFISFALIGIIGLFLNYGIVQLFSWTVTTKGWLFYVAKGIATMVTFLWNFFVRKFLLYSHKREEQAEVTNGEYD